MNNSNNFDPPPVPSDTHVQGKLQEEEEIPKHIPKSKRAKMSKSRSFDKRTKSTSNEREMLKSMGYTVGKTIGKGTYSKVCVATSLHQEPPEHIACKMIAKKLAGPEFMRKFLPRELNIVRNLQHKHIVAVHNVIDMHDSIYIIMDYCKNGDLLEYIRDRGPLDEDMARLYFGQIVSAVSYLHALDIAHRDLKCENILLSSEEHLKLGDFGFARFCVNEDGEQVLSETYCGSAAYAAPEVIQGIPYDPKMYDIWSIGCILYIMIAATMPFDDRNIRKMLRCQLNRSLCVSSYKSWSNLCLHLRTLIAYLLEPEVDQRATIRNVSNCMWLNMKRDQDMISTRRCYSDYEDLNLSKSSIF